MRLQTHYYLRQADELTWIEALIIAIKHIDGADWEVRTTAWADVATGEVTVAGADRPASPNNVAHRAIIDALKDRVLKPFVYSADRERRFIPFDYWMRAIGQASVNTGVFVEPRAHVASGVSVDIEGDPFFVLESELAAWLESIECKGPGYDTEPGPTPPPEPNPDIKQARRYLAVLAEAEKLYPDPGRRPSARTMAIKVAGGETGKFQGLGWRAITKIIGGRYEPASALDIEGLASRDSSPIQSSDC